MTELRIEGDEERSAPHGFDPADLPDEEELAERARWLAFAEANPPPRYLFPGEPTLDLGEPAPEPWWRVLARRLGRLR